MTDIIQNPPQDAKQIEEYTNDVIEDNPNEQLEDNVKKDNANTSTENIIGKQIEDNTENDINSFLDKIVETDDKDELFELIISKYNSIKDDIRNGQPLDDIKDLRTALYKYEDRCNKPEHIQTLAEIVETYNLTHEVDDMSHNEDEFIGKIHSFFTKIKDKPEQKETYNKSRKKLDIMLNIYKNRYGEDRFNENFGEILKIREEWDKLITKQEEKKKRQTLTEPKVLSHMAQKTMNAIKNKQKLSEGNWGEMTEGIIKATEAIGVTGLIAINPIFGVILAIIYVLDVNGVEPVHTVCDKYREIFNKKIISFANELQKKHTASKNKEFDGTLKYLENYTKPMEFPKKKEKQLKVTDNKETPQNKAPKPAPTGEQKIENDTLKQKPTSPSTDPLPPLFTNKNINQPQNQQEQENMEEQQKTEPTTHLEKEQLRRRLGNDLGLG